MPTQSKWQSLPTEAINPVSLAVDKTPVPGFGTFTCRVMIFEDQYAGTWDGANHGGHLFGKVVRAGEEDAKAKAQPQKNGGKQPEKGEPAKKADGDSKSI